MRVQLNVDFNMIQRIQSVYLFLSAALLTLMFFFPIAEIKGDSTVYEFSAFGFLENGNTSVNGDIFLADLQPLIPVYLWIAVNIMLVALSLMLFKKRGIQLKLNRLILLLTSALVVYLYYEADKFTAYLTGECYLVYLASIYFAIATLPLLFLANRGIKKDEDLIKSLDRIR